MRTIVLGLDGSSFELIDPWIENGELSNLKKIKERGVFGDLKSELPPVTAPNWKCYSTGKNPCKLGVFWWENIDWDDQKVYCPDYRALENKEIWDYLNDKGHKVAIINLPTSFPPKKVNGYFISGGPDSSSKNYYYPSNLADLIKETNYRVRPRKSILSAEDCKSEFKEIVGLMKTRFRLMEKLLEKDPEIEFIHLTIYFINVLHHFLWDHELVKKAWRILDEEIGKLMRMEATNLIIISDHGSNEIKDVFNLNTWLEEGNHLKTGSNILAKILEKTGINREIISKTADFLGIKEILKDNVPSKITGFITSEDGGIRKEAKGELINWEKTSAIGSGQGPIYINKEKLGQKYEEFRNSLIDKLEELKSPLTERKIIKKVFKKEEIYSGKYLEKAPDLIIDQGPNVHISGKIGKKQIFGKPGKWKGENKKTGIFAGIGPEIRRGEDIGSISILDIAPTLLHLYDISLPTDLDGRTLKKIFANDSKPAKQKVKFRKKRSEKSKIKGKISELKETRRI